MDLPNQSWEDRGSAELRTRRSGLSSPTLAESQSNWKGIGPAQSPGVRDLALPRGGETKKSHDKRLESREE